MNTCDIVRIAMTQCRYTRSCLHCCYHEHKQWLSCQMENLAIDMILDNLY